MKKSIPALLYFLGLLLASSDGQWFPWINFAGIALMPIAILTGKSILKQEEK
jgi:hypothetical protein